MPRPSFEAKNPAKGLTARKLLQTGWSCTAVGKTLGVSHSAIERFARRHRLTPKRQKPKKHQTRRVNRTTTISALDALIAKARQHLRDIDDAANKYSLIIEWLEAQQPTNKE